MEWMGLMAIALALCFSSANSTKIKRLERKIKKQTAGEGKTEMSKLISELVGKYCEIAVDNDLSGIVKATVIDVDEDWVKLSVDMKKGGKKTKIMRVDSIKEITVME